jgi:STE24 endopeptidase
MDFIANCFFWVFLAFYTAYLVVEIGLDILNLRYIDRHKDIIPHLFLGVYSEEDYKKSIDYTKVKTHFKIYSLIFKTILLFVFIFSSFFGAMDLWLSACIGSSFVRGIVYPLVIFGIFYLFMLPQTYYFQFVIEERFGFNRMDKKTFFVDQIKAIGLGLVFGVPLIAALLWIIYEIGDLWWVYGFLLIMGFQLFTAAIYPVLLAPIFNKFTPLKEGSLRQRIEALAKEVRFKMAGIFTIDGSKRSSHSTLVEKHSDDEIIAVIAHEMGHNVKKHIQKSLLVSSLVTFLLFYILALALKWPPFFEALGAHEPSVHVGLVLFFLFSFVFLFPVTPLFTKLSRINEFEADEFSVHITNDREHLKTALVKLTKENLGNLTPHPWYSAYHYSHPTTLERVSAIEAIKL